MSARGRRRLHPSFNLANFWERDRAKIRLQIEECALSPEHDRAPRVCADSPSAPNHGTKRGARAVRGSLIVQAQTRQLHAPAAFPTAAAPQFYLDVANEICTEQTNNSSPFHRRRHRRVPRAAAIAERARRSVGAPLCRAPARAASSAHPPPATTCARCDGGDLPSGMLHAHKARLCLLRHRLRRLPHRAGGYLRAHVRHT